VFVVISLMGIHCHRRHRICRHWWHWPQYFSRYWDKSI